MPRKPNRRTQAESKKTVGANTTPKVPKRRGVKRKREEVERNVCDAVPSAIEEPVVKKSNPEAVERPKKVSRQGMVEVSTTPEPPQKSGVKRKREEMEDNKEDTVNEEKDARIEESVVVEAISFSSCIDINESDVASRHSFYSAFGVLTRSEGNSDLGSRTRKRGDDDDVDKENDDNNIDKDDNDDMDEDVCKRIKKRACRREETSSASQAAFEAKYVQEYQLGAGGCGSVFAGYRIEDNLQVAIKHVHKRLCQSKHPDENGTLVPIEVAVMQRLQKRAAAPVKLLDWYDLHSELILVLERPPSALDIFDYIVIFGGDPDEDQAKAIMKQLVEAAIDLEENNIFHRDIKLENILLETTSDVPRVRLIDFGLSCITKKRSSYRVFMGTPIHTPPEWLRTKKYKPGPTTVWQLGVVLYDMLHTNQRFTTDAFMSNDLAIRPDLSEEYIAFMSSCLDQDPEKRPTLGELRDHPWLQEREEDEEDDQEQQ